MALAEKIHEGLQKHMEKSKEKESKKKSSKKEIHHFEIHPMEGGHMLETHHKRPASYDSPPEEPKRSMHKSMGSAMKEMKASCPCGACAGGEADSGVAEEEQ